MESYALALSPFTPFLKSRKPPNRNPNHNPKPVLASHSFFSSSKSPDLSLLRSFSLYSASSNNRATSVSLLISNPRLNDFKVRAASVPENADETEKSNELGRTLQLGFMVATWYLLNIYFNIYNKQETMSCRLKQILWNMDKGQSSTTKNRSMMAMVPNKDPLVRSTKGSTTGSTRGVCGKDGHRAKDCHVRKNGGSSSKKPAQANIAEDFYLSNGVADINLAAVISEANLVGNPKE